MERRNFLKFLGVGSYSMVSSLQTFGFASDTKKLSSKKQLQTAKKLGFTPITPNSDDVLVLPKEYRHSIVAKWKDSLGSVGPRGAEFFGYDNDFTQFLSIDSLAGGTSSREGLLFVNHENVTSLLVSQYAGNRNRSLEEVNYEKLNVGASVLHIKKNQENGTWQLVSGSKYNRRITALYPEILMSGPAAKKLISGTGTLANCSGGKTLWNTILTCEENFDEMNRLEEGLNWASASGAVIDEEKYGWVVEIDPFVEVESKKHTALGRFAHENACMRLSPKNKLVVYMGDDRANECLYKFVSEDSYDSKKPRSECSKILERGTLYVANMQTKRWIPLDLEKNKDLKNAGFKDQGDLLVNTRKAAKIAGATPLDRPEDCEIDPKDGTLYVAFTNNSSVKNYHGHILHIREKDNNPESLNFEFDVLLAGGEDSGLSCPDNLIFDPQGNLWVSCDISSAKLGKKPYDQFGNNGFFRVILEGSDRGKAYQFASAPVEAELTGPSFTPDGKTLFLSVQHPGEMSVDYAKPTSSWPFKAPEIPSPAVVAIERI